MGSDDGSQNGLIPGQRFGRYEIVRLLGKGGMGAVYEARNVTLGKRVAVKTLLVSASDDPTTAARFVREGQAASRVRNPHIVEIFDADVHEGVPFLVMEYLEGESLAQLMERERVLPLARLVKLALPVIAAIAAAHEVGVVHRDIKPENVFLAREGRNVVPKVLDFGISKVSSATNRVRLTATGAMMGTPLYMAPEQARGNVEQVDARSDQYSLGVVLYECATGAEPFAAENFLALLQEILAARYPRPRAVRPELPEAFEHVVLRAMALEPAARFGSMRELGRALLPFADAGTREQWSAEFDDAHEPTLASFDAPSIVDSPTMPPDTVVARRTTLGRTGREIDARATARGARSWTLVVVGLLAVAACGVVIALKLHHGTNDATARGAVPPPPVALSTPAVVPPRPATQPAAGVALPSSVDRDAAAVAVAPAPDERLLVGGHAGHRPSRPHTHATSTPSGNPPPAVGAQAGPAGPHTGVHAAQSYE